MAVRVYLSGLLLLVITCSPESLKRWSLQPFTEKSTGKCPLVQGILPLELQGLAGVCCHGNTGMLMEAAEVPLLLYESWE